MKPRDPRLAAAVALAGLVMALWLALLSAAIWATLGPAERSAVRELLAARAGLVLTGWLLGLAVVGAVLYALHRRYVAAPRQLAEEARALLADRGARRLAPHGTPELRALTALVNELAAQRDALRADVDARATQASERVQQEKDRLAALMAELQQSVLVCNQAGRILLYNQRARETFRALSPDLQPAAGAELIGIGRSIYAALERQVLAHTFERVERAVAQGSAQQTAQFVTTVAGGQLLRVQVAPVRAHQGMLGRSTDVTGFVLMLDNVTASVAEESERDQLLHGLTEGSRASLANIQAAVDMLGLPDTAPAMRERFLGVVRDEVASMGQRVTDLAARSAQRLQTRWPLEDMLGADLVAAAQRQLGVHCRCPVTLEASDPSLWLKVDSYTLLQALTYLGTRLVDEFQVRFLELRLARAGAHAQLDLVWSGQAMSNETVMSWELDAMRFGAESTPLSVREVVERHGGEMWFERERVRHQALFRFLLPLARAHREAAGTGPAGAGGRPEYYDFDLFQDTPELSALEDRRLSDLAYTVFDTETTGLNPASGDAIVQIGAARIVNGKLLRQESFDQLVDPGRPIPAAATAIHGITHAMVAGQPRIGQVLPMFHVFAADTVLVAHNAAFDMKFLQLQETAAGVVFGQPVLDTLLLSVVVHPGEVAHGLDAVAGRLGVPLDGRHTALGDAQATAQIWLRLVPLLAERGIETLRQAREAAQKAFQMRLK